MKFGPRKPSLKKSLKARTTGKAKRAARKALIPGYGEKGTGWIKDPKKAAYNKIYRKTTFSLWDLFKQSLCIDESKKMCYTCLTESQSTSTGGLPSLTPEGLPLQTRERRVMPMYVTYSDLIQIGIFIVALISLIYEIFKDRKQPPLLTIVTADPVWD